MVICTPTILELPARLVGNLTRVSFLPATASAACMAFEMGPVAQSCKIQELSEPWEPPSFLQEWVFQITTRHPPLHAWG